jgi:hypothetical protein
MDYQRRNTHSYGFKAFDLARLRKLGSLVSDSEEFRKSHGKLLGILGTNIEEGILNTLV